MRNLIVPAAAIGLGAYYFRDALVNPTEPGYQTKEVSTIKKFLDSSEETLQQHSDQATFKFGCSPQNTEGIKHSAELTARERQALMFLVRPCTANPDSDINSYDALTTMYYKGPRQKNLVQLRQVAALELAIRKQAPLDCDPCVRLVNLTPNSRWHGLGSLGKGQSTHLSPHQILTTTNPFGFSPDTYAFTGFLQPPEPDGHLTSIAKKVRIFRYSSSESSQCRLINPDPLKGECYVSTQSTFKVKDVKDVSLINPKTVTLDLYTFSQEMETLEDLNGLVQAKPKSVLNLGFKIVDSNNETVSLSFDIHIDELGDICKFFKINNLKQGASETETLTNLYNTFKEMDPKQLFRRFKQYSREFQEIIIPRNVEVVDITDSWE